MQDVDQSEAKNMPSASPQGIAIMKLTNNTPEMSPVANNETPVAGRILAIDDDRGLLENFSLCLSKEGYRVVTAETLEEGMRLAATLPFQVCLLDRNIGYDSGLSALPKLRELAPLMRVIMVTGHAGVADAIDAIAKGANDYLVKPCSPEQLRIAVARQVDTRRMIDKLDAFENESNTRSTQLNSKNEAMLAAINLAMQVAKTDANILLLGESGTGKGVLARAIHDASQRAKGAFVTVNCPSLTAELLESEMFGHIKGSFTGASQTNVGRVSHADGGTIFLDEVGDFPLLLQPKLLRFVQDREYERVGDPLTRKADARIIAATNRDLDAMVKEGQFRLDLLYRLNVIAITLPALRERLEDLDELATGFIRRFASSYGMPARRLAASALAQLQLYAWPGNVRELQNMMERAVILCRGEEIGAELLALGRSESAKQQVIPGASMSLETLERAHIERVLATSENLDAAAKTLGIDASTLYRKRKTYKL
jgi:NtrC-family two-component system response regulator AlgB